MSLLAYSGPRPESEALPLRWSQSGARTITYRAAKVGRVKLAARGCAHRSRATSPSSVSAAAAEATTSSCSASGRAPTGTTGGSGSSSNLDIYGPLFEEFDPSQRRRAVDVIREAGDTVRKGAVPTRYPAPRRNEDEGDASAAKSPE